MKRYAVSFITIIILLVGLIFWNIGSGSISISWDELWNILLKQTEEGTAYHIIWDIRLPRILAAVMLGGAVVTLFCDGIARTLFAPTEVSISTVTAVFLVPVVIVMMLRRQEERG